MIHRSLSYDPTAEHRLTRAKWARGFGVVYGTILLLLLAIVVAQHIRGVPAELRPTIAIGPPTASQATNPTSHTDWE